jgi:HEAT repeat protein
MVVPQALRSQTVSVDVPGVSVAVNDKSVIVIPSDLSDDYESQADTALAAAKRVLEDGDFREAAQLFKRVAQRYPKSSQAAEALYWQAWSLFRTGSSSNLSSALTVLNDLNRLYPSSAANKGDAGSLKIRICGEMARRGNEECAQDIVTRATTTTSTSTSTTTSTSQGGGQARSCPSADDDNDERIMAINALMNMNAEAAVPILQRVLERKDDCSKGLRKKAVFLLSQKRSPEVVDILLKAAREDPSPDVREDAVFWLSNVRDERVVDMLAEMALNNNDPAIQEKAIFSLSNTRSEKASQVLRDIAQRETASKGAREQAIFWLGNRRDTSSTAFLRGLYPRLTDKDLKEKVLFSVANQRASGSGQWLINIAMNERETMELRKQALFWAGNNKAATIPEIAALYDRVTDKEMKEQIIFVLSQQSKDSAAIDKLMAIARSDTDREMRSKAIFWLGQSRDPRVLKFLEELINK